MVHITLIQALLIGAWVGFTRGGKVGYSFLICQRPIITALVIGIILGKIPEAMVIGAAVQLIYMGLIAPGGNYAADDTVATAVAVTAGLTTGITPTQAVVIAVPVGLVSNYIATIKYIINSFFIHMADGYARKRNTSGITLSATVYPFAVGFLLYFVTVTIAVYKGPAVISALVQATPESIMHALSVVGGALPALGFALTVFVIGRKNLALYFVVAFFLAIALKSLNINMVIYAILGGTMAYMHVLFTSRSGSEATPAGRKGAT